ncbi:MAG: hypothetical protein E3K32_04075 [wastewater metagenome]|nr:hypothetical protein [Candidatus Loosdrechtia aerotolerans]
MNPKPVEREVLAIKKEQLQRRMLGTILDFSSLFYLNCETWVNVFLNYNTYASSASMVSLEFPTALRRWYQLLLTIGIFEV